MIGDLSLLVPEIRMQGISCNHRLSPQLTILGVGVGSGANRDVGIPAHLEQVPARTQCPLRSPGNEGPVSWE